MSVLDKISAGDYASKLPYASKPQTPDILRGRMVDLDPSLVDVAHAALVRHNAAVTEAAEANRRRREDQAALDQQFEEDLAAEFGLTDHPKRGKVYALAYDMGHSSGLGDIYHHYSDLAELVL